MPILRNMAPLRIDYQYLFWTMINHIYPKDFHLNKTNISDQESSVEDVQKELQSQNIPYQWHQEDKQTVSTEATMQRKAK